MFKGFCDPAARHLYLLLTGYGYVGKQADLSHSHSEQIQKEPVLSVVIMIQTEVVLSWILLSPLHLASSCDHVTMTIQT